MTPERGEKQKEVTIVDLSCPGPRTERVREQKLHREVLSFVESKGEVSKRDLVLWFRQARYGELVRVLEDLSLMGKLEVHWTSPFSFTVRRVDEERTRPASRRLVLA